MEDEVGRADERGFGVWGMGYVCVMAAFLFFFFSGFLLGREVSDER